MILVSVLVILTLAMITALTISVRKNILLLERMEEIAEQVEESLDILDECHQNIDLKSKTEVLFDDPLVKGLIQDINGCKNAVLLVANKIYSPLEQGEKQDTKTTYEGKEP